MNGWPPSSAVSGSKSSGASPGANSGEELEDHLVAGLALQGEAVLDHAEQRADLDGAAQLLAELAHDGLGGGLAELDLAAEGAIEGLALHVVVPLGEEQVVLVQQQADRGAAGCAAAARRRTPRLAAVCARAASAPSRSLAVTRAAR